MLASLTKLMNDRSTKQRFEFGFLCDICSKEWRSPPIPFSKTQQDANAPPSGEEVVQLIWQCEHNAAYERANHQAMLELNHCPVCGKWVCQECFYVRSDTITDICVECAKGQM